jgi:integrase
MVIRDQYPGLADDGVRGEGAWHDNGAALVTDRSANARTAHGDATRDRSACAQTNFSATATTRQGALDLLAEKVAAFERGLNLELTPDITLIAYLRWWTDVELVEQVEDGIITATTRKAYVGQVNNHIVCYPEWRGLRDLSGAKVRNWQTWLRTNGRTANTRKAGLAVLKTALMKAWKFELIPTNPAQLVDPPRVRRQRRGEITIEDVRTLLAATADSMRLGALLQTACHVPYRPGELFGAEWDAMDLDEGLFDVRANLVRHDGRYLLHDTKTHERREVPLAGTVVDALRRHRKAQAEERLAAGAEWQRPVVWVRAEDTERELDLVFTRDLGRP